jgi:PleD family two-component response regulator
LEESLILERSLQEKVLQLEKSLQSESRNEQNKEKEADVFSHQLQKAAKIENPEINTSSRELYTNYNPTSEQENGKNIVRKVLLADDSVVTQRIVKLAFTQENVEVFSLLSGDWEMKRITEVLPDVVIADANMSGIDCYELCKMIRQNEMTKDIPVILLVSSFAEFDEVRAREVGVDDYFTKPFHSITELVKTVTKLIDHTQKTF